MLIASTKSTPAYQVVSNCCSQGTGKRSLNIAQGYRWLLGTAWSQQLTSGLQLRPGYVASKADQIPKPSSAPYDNNAVVSQ